MPRRRALVLGLVLAACGATSMETAGPVSALPDVCEGRCDEGATCRNSVTWRCECTAVPDQNCGGAPRELGPPVWTWLCTPLDPHADRGDGCPFGEPEAGSRCEGVRACRYADGGCGWSGNDARSDGAAWTLAAFEVPPPP